MGLLLIVAAYAVYAAFWIRVFTHALLWCRAARRYRGFGTPAVRSPLRLCGLAGLDIVLFGRLFYVNPALWLGEWVFHASLALVLVRHLRYFLSPVPRFVSWAQTPGLIAGYILPVALVYILVVRLLTKQEKYTSRQNAVLLGLLLVISTMGLAMRAWFRPDLATVKLFILGILGLSPQAAPGSTLFLAHFCLVLVLVLLLPTHIFSAPIVMMEARMRGDALRRMMHEE